MGRPVAGVLSLLLLLPLAGAIEDPAGDVSRQVGGPPVEAPWIDIRQATYTTEGDRLLLRMQLEAAPGDAPSNATLQFLFPFDLDGEPGAQVFGNDDGTIRCMLEAGGFGCQDTSGAFTVLAAGLQGRNVTATVRLPEADETIALAGASTMLQDGNVTGQDFTDNALPYNSRPPTDDPVATPEPPAEGADRTWAWLLLAAGIGGLAFWWVRQRA